MNETATITSLVDGTNLPTPHPFAIPKTCHFLLMTAYKLRSAWRVYGSIWWSIWPSTNIVQAKADAISNAAAARFHEIKALPLGDELIQAMRVFYIVQRVLRLGDLKTKTIYAYQYTYDAYKGTYSDGISYRDRVSLIQQEAYELLCCISSIVANIWEIYDAVWNFTPATEQEILRSSVHDAVTTLLDDSGDEIPEANKDLKTKITTNLRKSFKTNLVLAERIMQDLQVKKESLFKAMGVVDALIGDDSTKTTGQQPLSNTTKQRKLQDIYQPVTHSYTEITKKV